MKNRGRDMALIFGRDKGDASSSDEGDDEDWGPGGDHGADEESEGDTSEDVPLEFETAAKEAFPDLDPERLKAFYRAIEACRG